MYAPPSLVRGRGLQISARKITEVWIKRTNAITVQAHGNEKREVKAEPVRGPTIWPKEKDEAIKLLNELTACSAESPHECIMSSITGVIDMDSPTPNITRAVTI